MDEKVTVFIVDDDEEDIEILTTAFKAIDCTEQVVSFTTGDAFLTAIGALPAASLPHLVVLDHQLPGSDGGDTVIRLRCDRRFDRIAIVVYTTAIALPKIKTQEAQGVDLCQLKGCSQAEITTHAKQFCQLALEHKRKYG